MKKLKPAYWLIACAALLTGCSAVSLLNASIPSDGYRIHKDIAYGNDARQKLDIYIPDAATPANPSPVIVFYYGGSWQQGSKDDYLFLGESFATLGYVTVIADYRLYPQVSFPTFIDDSAQAFGWVHKNIANYNGDENNLFLAGHSAGAYNAVMLAVNHDYFNRVNIKPSWVRGTIGIAGPYDFLPLTDPTLIKLFSTAAQEKDTQPITFVNKKYAPIFLATGDSDEEVLPRNSIILDQRLKQLGSPVESHIYTNIDHINIMLSLACRFRGKSTLREDIRKFIEENKAKPTGNVH
ncbi:MAG: alpha/beta hydrolase [Alphaproteobacteria bacterium]|nr:alpha/beta hydrolase [Alphaproteobacteria bacterium]